MTALRAFWLILAALSAVCGVFFGVPIWLSAGVLLCASAPALAGMFMQGSAPLRPIVEIEAMLWVGLATLACASTGGAGSAAGILFLIGPIWACAAGSNRLAAEATIFAIAGWVLSAIAGGGAGWMDAEDARVIGETLGAAAVVMGSVSAAMILVLRPSPKSVTPDSLARRALAAAASAEREAVAAREAARTAREALESRTRFFAQTSHELRTPLNAIVGFSDMMRGGIFGPLPPRYQEYAELIREGATNLELVVDDVLDLSRVEAGRFDYVPEQIDLGDYARDAVRFMADVARRKSVKLTCEGEADAFADTRAVRQIALNLISNALKFTPEGGAVTVSVVEAGHGSLLAVSDTGVGISAEELERLSRVFEQGEAGRHHKGSGLGLSVVRAMADLHGGSLEIESREGGGSTIAVFFPAERRPGDVLVRSAQTD
jgi:signal transduction histidine kinase